MARLWLALFATLLACCDAIVEKDGSNLLPRQPLDVNEPVVVQAAQVRVLTP